MKEAALAGSALCQMPVLDLRNRLPKSQITVVKTQFQPHLGQETERDHTHSPYKASIMDANCNVHSNKTIMFASFQATMYE
jgi:hypothetical protein